jgi:signal transduction histidine kinase
VDATIGTVQKIATELRPVVLDSLGLPAAIEWQLEDFEQRTAIRCRHSLPADQLPVDHEQATALFRILQESLTNVARHAQATQINVTLELEGDELVLTVSDNGSGMGPQSQTNPRALGLIGMRERAMALGGRLSISGSPGAGTTISARVPAVHFPERQRP